MSMGSNLSDDQRRALSDFASSPLCRESYLELTSKISVNDIFKALLITSNPDDVSLAVEIVRRLTSLGVMDEIINNQECVQVLKCLESKDANIRQLVCHIIHSLSSNKVTCKKLCDNGFHLVTGELLKDKEISIGESASKALKLMANSCQQCVYDDELIYNMKQGFSSLKDETRLRILDTYISIGSLSEEIFEICQKKGEFYSLALKEYFTDDVLLKLVSFKLLEDMSEYKWGVEFIVNNSTPELLIKDLTDPMLDDDIKISIVYLISKMVNNHPEMSSNVLNMLNKSFVQVFKEFMSSHCHGDNLNKTLCAINCWGLFSTRYSSFQSLISEWEESIQKMLDYLSNSNSDISLTCLNSWTVLFESEDIKDIIRNLKASFNFKQLVENKLIPTVLADTVSKPFPENRTLAYRLLTLMIPHFSCVSLNLCSNSKLKDLLLNNNSDSNKELLYIKHELIKQIVKYDKEALRGLSDEHFYKSIVEYADFGPFYRSQSAEMRVQDSVV